MVVCVTCCSCIASMSGLTLFQRIREKRYCQFLNHREVCCVFMVIECLAIVFVITQHKLCHSICTSSTVIVTMHIQCRTRNQNNTKYNTDANISSIPINMCLYATTDTNISFINYAVCAVIPLEIRWKICLVYVFDKNRFKCKAYVTTAR